MNFLFLSVRIETLVAKSVSRSGQGHLPRSADERKLPLSPPFTLLQFSSAVPISFWRLFRVSAFSRLGKKRGPLCLAFGCASPFSVERSALLGVAFQEAFSLCLFSFFFPLSEPRLCLHSVPFSAAPAFLIKLDAAGPFGASRILIPVRRLEKR